MKISFLSIIDFANVLTEYSYCLNKHSKDIESKSICFQKHPFNYNIQHDYDVEECDADQIAKSKQFLLESDIIIFAEESWEGQQPHLVYKTIEKFSIVYGIDLFKINVGNGVPESLAKQQIMNSVPFNLFPLINDYLK